MMEDLFVTDEIHKRIASGMPFREACTAAKAGFFKRAAEKDAASEAKRAKHA
jgi:hypothetical protein